MQEIFESIISVIIYIFVGFFSIIIICLFLGGLGGELYKLFSTKKDKK